MVLVFYSTLGTGLLAMNQEVPKVVNFPKHPNPAFNQVWAVEQGKDGILYFGTSGGLLLYDGALWTTFELPNKQTIRSLFIDDANRIFCGSFEEMGYWQFDHHKRLEFHSLMEYFPDEALSKEEIWNIFSKDNTIYGQTFSSIFEINALDVKAVRTPGNIMFGRATKAHVYIPVIGKGLYELNENGVFNLVPGGDIFADTKIDLILEIAPETVILGTKDKGIFIFDGNEFKEWNSNLNQSLIGFQLNKGIRLSSGMIAIGTVLNGIFFLDQNGNILYHLNQKNGLQNNTVLGLAEDSNGDMWVATDKGIDLVLFDSPFLYYRDKMGELGTVYTAVKYKNRLYIGTNHGLFYRENTDDFILVDETQGQVWSLDIIEGRLVCGHNSGTFLLNDNNTLERISNVTGGWVLRQIPGDKKHYVQGTYTGLCLYELDNHGKLNFKWRVNGFGEGVKNLVFDESGHIWMAHPNRGLFRARFGHDHSSLESITSFGPGKGLPQEFDLKLFQIDQQIYVKAGPSYYFFDAIKQEFVFATTIGKAKIAQGDFLFFEEKDVGEWMKIYKNHVVWKHKQDSLKLDIALVTGNEHIRLLDKDTYFFPLEDGYALLDRHHFSPFNKNFANAFITEIRTEKQHYYIPTFGLQEERVFQFPATQNNIAIYFSNTFFGRNVSYSFKLEGFSDHWTPFNQIHFKEFTNLDYGIYTFKVKTDVNENQIASIQFEIFPHWYETAWAKAIYLVLLFLVSYLLNKWHKYRLKQQQIKLQEAKERQLEEERIKNKNEKLQTEILNKNKELVNSTFNLIRKNELLLKIKEELQCVKTQYIHSKNDPHFTSLIKLLDENISDEKDWQVFETHFEAVHDSFFRKLKDAFPDLTPGDLKLAAYLKMNLSSKEIAPLLNISIRGIENKRYRLRKKMNLDSDANLTEFMMQL